jgi:1-acyl-sn-glycerol-3-phosphate acyltransferase
MSDSVASLERLDADRISTPEPLLAAARRRFMGRYPVDPFGLDPQLADLAAPVMAAMIRVQTSGGEHVPDHGPAVIVANRGFGIAEPTALGIAVQHATGRRVRFVGAPQMPIIGPLTRRLGAIASTDDDVVAALHAGHLVGLPLSPTWMRTGAGAVPLAVAPAMTHAPIVPAAVQTVGRLGTVLGAWQVRFGPVVTLPETYDRDDPIAAARFADEVRRSVAAVLAEL